MLNFIETGADLNLKKLVQLYFILLKILIIKL